METINFDETLFLDNSINRTVNQLFAVFFFNIKEEHFITIEEYYRSKSASYSSFNEYPTMHGIIEIVPTIYKDQFSPTPELYSEFRKAYFRQLIISFLLSQNCNLSDYRINIARLNLV